MQTVILTIPSYNILNVFGDIIYTYNTNVTNYSTDMN